MSPVPDVPPYLLILICSICVLIVGIGKTGFGGAIGVVCVPLMSLVMSPMQAAGILLPILIVCDLFAIWHYRRIYDLGSLKILIPSGILGIICGAILLWLVHDSILLTKRLLEFVIGLIALVFILYQVFSPALLRNRFMQGKAESWGQILGWTAGFGSTLAHAGGPPVTMYLLVRKMDRRVYVGTIVWAFAIFNLVKLIPYAAFGMLSHANLMMSLYFMPLVPVGIYLGLYLNRRVSQKVFYFIVYLFLLLISMELLTGGWLLRFIMNLFGKA